MTQDIALEKQTEKELEDLKKRADEYLQGWKRAQADLANYKKDELKQRTDFIKFANENIIQDLLELIDYFDAALKHKPKELSKDADTYISGLLHIRKGFDELLKKYGVKKIETENIPFNPEIHEAVGEDHEGSMVEQRSGYMMHGRVIRPTRVTFEKKQ